MKKDVFINFTSASLFFNKVAGLRPKLGRLERNLSTLDWARK